MRLEQSKIQKIKTAAHAIQGILIFVAGCLTIAVLTGSDTDGRTAYYFALVSLQSCLRTPITSRAYSNACQCFLTMPAFIYLVGVPMWSRTVRFASAYAFALLDGLYTVRPLKDLYN